MNNAEAEKLLKSTTPEEREYLLQAETMVEDLLQIFMQVAVCPLAAVAMGAAIIQIVSCRPLATEAERLRACVLGTAFGHRVVGEAHRRSSLRDDSTYSKADKARAARLAKDALAKITGDTE